MRTMTRLCGAMAIALLATVACDHDRVTAPDDALDARAVPGPALEGHSFAGEGMVFDIAALPNGNLLVAVTDLDLGGNTIQEIGRHGAEVVTDIPVTPGSPVNGLEPLGQREFFATSGGQDLTVGAGLWRVSQGNARLVADIAASTMGGWDPDVENQFADNELADAGPYPEDWKDFRCETFAEFSHGPQTNPYHLTALSGSEVLIGDAANNGVLWANTTGQIEVVAFMEPATDPDTGDWMVLGYVDEDGAIVGIGEAADGPVECYVEPVPTSVAVGPDGAWYVGELTGTTPANFFRGHTPHGMARVWRVEPGTRNVTCPSAACEVVVSGLNSVIDVEFGPDDLLYVVEYEQNGFLGTVAPDLGIDLAGGTLLRCDVRNGNVGREACTRLLGGEEGNTTEMELPFPGAVTFDKSENLWLVENVFAPTVRPVDWK